MADFTRFWPNQQGKQNLPKQKIWVSCIHKIYFLWPYIRNAEMFILYMLKDYEPISKCNKNIDEGLDSVLSQEQFYWWKDEVIF